MTIQGVASGQAMLPASLPTCRLSASAGRSQGGVPNRKNDLDAGLGMRHLFQPSKLSSSKGAGTRLLSVSVRIRASSPTGSSRRGRRSSVPTARTPGNGSSTRRAASTTEAGAPMSP